MSVLMWLSPDDVELFSIVKSVLICLSSLNGFGDKMQTSVNVRF